RMTTGPDDTNVFIIPDAAATSAGAMFFAQHFDDLTWAASQSMLAKEIEDLTDMIAEAVGKTRESSVWESDIFRNTGLADADEAIAWARRHFKSKSEFARKVVRSTSQTSAETILCRYVDNYLCYLSDLLRLLFAKYPKSL